MNEQIQVNSKDIRRILIILFRGIGDVLLTTPLVRVLHRRFPEAKIDFLTEPASAQMLEGNPYIKEILVFRYRRQHLKALGFYHSLKKRNYDLTIDLRGTSGTALASFLSRAKHRIGYRVRGRKLAYTIHVSPYSRGIYTALDRFRLVEPIGIEEAEWKPDLILKESERVFAGNFITSLGWENTFLISISPTSRCQTRLWRAEGFINTIKLLYKKYGIKSLLLWGPGEEEYVKAVFEKTGDEAAMIPPTTMKEMSAIIARTNALITNNNGPKHCAVSAGVPTVSIYGSGSETAWDPPDRANHRIVKAGIPCIGCHLKYCEHLTCMHLVNQFDVESEFIQIPAVDAYLKKKDAPQ